EDTGRDDAGDGRGDHEAVTAEAGRDVESFVPRHRAEHRLPIGRHVVGAARETGEVDLLQSGQEPADPLPYGGAPARCVLRWIAHRAEVAREHAGVPALLRRGVELRRDAARLEQALAARLAQEQLSPLPLDRQCRTEWAEEVV